MRYSEIEVISVYILYLSSSEFTSSVKKR